MSKFTNTVWLVTAAIAGIAVCVPSWHATVRADCTPQWVSGFGNPEGPLSGPAWAMAVYDDGNGPALYAAGAFVSNSGITVYSVTKWNGSSWQPLGTGPSGTVRALAVFDDGTGPALYAGGDFTFVGVPPNHIAKYDGAGWSAVGAGVSGTVWALTVFDDGTGPALYAGGAFTSAGGGAANRVAKWNGISWSPLGTGTSGIIRSLEVFNDGSGSALYAGGDFVSAGGSAVQRMARWNGTNWSGMAGGMNDTVWSLRASAGTLYAGGTFTTAGGGAANRIAQWNGTAWSAVGTGMSDAVYALREYDDGNGTALYAGGAFTQVNGVAINRIAKWNGTAWSGVAGGADAEVRSLVAYDDGVSNRLCASGLFGMLDNHAVRSVGVWNGSEWSALGGEGGTDGPIERLIPFDDGSGPALFASGGFKTAGGVSAKGLAKWDGFAWTALNVSATASGVLEVVDDGSGPHLFAAIYSPPALSSNGVAKWDGNSFTTVAAGLGDPINDLVGFDDGTGSALYAGGRFRTSAGVQLNGIAKLNGNAWSELGTGLCGGTECGVEALAVFDDGNGPALYAGGNFAAAGGLAARNIAKWDGAAWSTMQTGVNQRVYSLAVFDDGSGPALYVGGQFWEANQIEAVGIARWNGSTWSPVGDGFRAGIVMSMEVFDDGNGPALYVAGYAIGGQAYPRRLGKWDGVSWQFAEIGTDQDPVTLAVFNGGSSPRLFIGGGFTMAGNGPAYHIAAMSGCNFIVPAPTPPPAPTPDPSPIDPVVDPSDPVSDDQAPPDPVESIDNGATAQSGVPQLADQIKTPAASGANPCGMGLVMASSALLTGMWLMRRTRRKQA